MSLFFGTHRLHTSEIFFRSKTCIGIVNLKPIVPGHVLLLPIRRTERFEELLPEEITDLFQSVQTVGRVIEKRYGASSLSIVVQDGPEAGQTVKHVHVHVLPRKMNDFKQNDEVYDHLEGHKSRIDNEARSPRSIDEMAKEANELSHLFT